MPCNLWMRLALVVLLPCLATSSLAADQPSAESAAVRKAVSSFVQAFNAGDAKAMLEAWTATGDFINESGKRFQIKELLLAEREAKAKPERSLVLEVEHVRFVAPTVATVDGFSIFRHANQVAPQHSRFTATLVNKDGKWMFDSIRESAAQINSHHQHLVELDWMLGEWVADHNGATLHTKLQWSDNGNYLIRTIEYAVPGRGEHAGTQWIGWDPRSQVFRSWMFTTDGGFNLGTWKPIENGVEIDTWGVTADGKSSTNIARYLRVDENSAIYESVEATLDGEDLPPVKLELKRKTAAQPPAVPAKRSATR